MKPTTFKDLFSSSSKEYASSRPKYPRSLFDFLVGLVQHTNRAWDCATGNGQAAAFLSDYFEQVIASDASKKQIENAQPRNNIRYEVFPAERTNLADSSVDLITIAQALHWFDLDSFYKEAKRVLRKDNNDCDGGVIAAWAYWLHSVSREIDKIMRLLYEDILGPSGQKKEKSLKINIKIYHFPFKRLTRQFFR